MKKQQSKMVATVWRHWKPVFKKYWLSLTIASLSYTFGLYMELLKPIWWKEIFDLIRLNQIPWNSFIYVFAISLVAWTTSRIGEFGLTYSESRVIENLKVYALNKLMHYNTEFFNNYSSGALIAKAKRFASNSESVIDQMIFSVFRTVFIAIYLVFFTSFVIPQLAPVFFVWSLIFVIFTFFMLRLRTPYDLESSSADSKTTSLFSDIILSIFTIRIFSNSHNEINNFKKVASDESKLRRKAWGIGHIQWAGQGVLMLILETLVMYIVISDVVEGKETLGTLVMIQAYIASLVSYMYNLGQSISRIRSSIADAYEMAHLLDFKEEENIVITKEFSPKTLFKRELVFEDVSFKYPNGQEILKDFNFTFKMGRHYGLIGHSGAGKTTITKLLLRLYEKTDGEICFRTDLRDVNPMTDSGHFYQKSINDIDKNLLRNQIAFVPQHPIFPSRKIRDIILLGKENATDEEIFSVCKKAHAEFVFELPNGLDTFVGERGVKLSGGEAQRIAIAMAILKDSPIVIMDEPTSALDAITEQSIQESIKKHFNEKLLIVIAHRLSTVAVLDEIILMGEGTVVDSAPHNELLEKSELYKTMWELQTNPVVV